MLSDMWLSNRLRLTSPLLCTILHLQCNRDVECKVTVQHQQQWQMGLPEHNLLGFWDLVQFSHVVSTRHVTSLQTERLCCDTSRRWHGLCAI